MAYTKTIWKDRVVQFGSRYKDQNDNQYTFTKDPGVVVEEGTPVNASNLNKIENALVDIDERVTKQRTDFENNVVKDDNRYAEMLDLQINTAYLLAREEVAGNVLGYSNFFYDLFYSGHTQKIGYIDNRYLSYTGTLSAGATTMLSANLNFTNYPVTDADKNINYQEFTIDDGVNHEQVYIKNIEFFNSNQYTGTYPTTLSLPSGNYYVDIRGGAGGTTSYRTSVGYGGKGATAKFQLNLLATDVLTIEKVSGGTGSTTGGNAFRLKKNGTVLAILGGGGGGGMFLDYNPSDPSNLGRAGGNAGGTNGGNGLNANEAVGGKGAIGSTGGTGGSGGDGGSAPNGVGGAGQVYYHATYGYGIGAGGGAGYAGGEGGGGYAGPNWLSQGSGGGASSYIDASITPTEYVTGSYTGAEFFSISTTNYEFKTPLQYSYTNPKIYRGNLTIDTTNHRASVTAINGVLVDKVDIRVLIRDPQNNFFDIASWLETTTDFTVERVQVSYGSLYDIDESVNVALPTNVYTGSTTKQIRTEAIGSSTSNYAVLTFQLSKVSDTAYIYKLLGVVN